ncbi:unnamed protein product [Effrenium voratum]|nr:unnamed protein product [Effrenium voratum]
MMVIDGQHVLSQEAILHAQGRHGPYNLVLQTKKASLPQPPSSLCVQILTEHGPFVHCVPAGTFLFQLLWDFPQWHYGIPIYSLDGSKQPADQRLWTSGIFLLYDPIGFGLPTTTTHLSTTHQLGLAASHIWSVSLLLQDYSPRSPLIINPWTALAVLHDAGIVAIPTSPPRECLIPLAAQGHWCLIHLRFDENQLEALCYDGLFSVPLSEATQLVSMLARFWQLPMPLITMRRHFQQFESTTCGCVMLAHLAVALGLDGSGFTEDPVGLTTLLQASFHGFGPFGCGPLTNPARQTLSALLVDKGVPDDKDFVPLDIQEIYHLYPLPFGTQRAGLQKALNQWKWRAKPLQPVRSDSHGLCWQVGAVSKPPGEILTLSTGDVLVSFSHAAKAPPPAAPLLASTRTNQLLRSQIHAPPGLAQDPWALGEDPWAAAAQHSSSAAPSGKWQQLSLELKQVQSSLHQQSTARLDQHMADDSEDRLSKLEVDMREIKEQNHKFESWFQDAAQSNQEANHKLHMVANQVASHQTQLSNLEQAVTQNSTTLQAVNSELREEMSRGFGNIEALLNKKLRSS